MKVRVVMGDVPLNLKGGVHVDGHATTQEHRRELGARLIEACDGKAITFLNFPLEKCWLYKDDPPLTCEALGPWEHKFPSVEEYAKWCMVICQFIEWGYMAYKNDPSIDMIVHFSYTLLKQGDFSGKPITQDHVRDFLKRVKTYDRNDIPYPGCSRIGPPNPHGQNWRFASSTLIWPTKYLKQLRKEFKYYTRLHIKKYKQIPSDVMVWPEVERYSALPFRQYRADFDHTQLTNFPDAA